MSELRNIPQNPLLGLVAAILSKVEGGLDKILPSGESTPQVNLGMFGGIPPIDKGTIKDLSGVPGARRVWEDASYGFPPTKGSGWATKVDPAVLDAAGVLPVANAGHKAAAKLANKALEPLAEGLLKATQGTVFEQNGALAKIFAGPMAQNPPPGLTEAKKALPQRAWRDEQGYYGPSPEAEQVWKEKGWFQDPAKDWKWEISDRDAQLHYGFNVDTKGNQISKGNGPAYTIFQHDKLYQQYPDLAKKPIYWELGPKVGGSAYSTHIEARAPTVHELRQVILHELQHSVQTREGHTLGADPKAFKDELLKTAPGLNPQARENLALTSYLNKLGEIDARSTEMRSSMPPAARRERAPWKDWTTFHTDSKTGEFRRDLEPNFSRILLRGGLGDKSKLGESLYPDGRKDLILAHASRLDRLVTGGRRGEGLNELLSPSLAIGPPGEVSRHFESGPTAYLIPRSGAFDPATSTTTLFNRDAYVHRWNQYPSGRHSYTWQDPQERARLRMQDRTEHYGKEKFGEGLTPGGSHDWTIEASPHFPSFAHYEKSPAGAGVLTSDPDFYHHERLVNRAKQEFMANPVVDNLLGAYPRIDKFSDLQNLVKAHPEIRRLPEYRELVDLVRRAPSNYAELKAHGPFQISPEHWAGAVIRGGHGSREAERYFNERGLRMIDAGQNPNSERLFDAATEIQRKAPAYGRKPLSGVHHFPVERPPKGNVEDLRANYDIDTMFKDAYSYGAWNAEEFKDWFKTQKSANPDDLPDLEDHYVEALAKDYEKFYGSPKKKVPDDWLNPKEEDFAPKPKVKQAPGLDYDHPVGIGQDSPMALAMGMEFKKGALKPNVQFNWSGKAHLVDETGALWQMDPESLGWAKKGQIFGPKHELDDAIELANKFADVDGEALLKDLENISNPWQTELSDLGKQPVHQTALQEAAEKWIQGHLLNFSKNGYDYMVTQNGQLYGMKPFGSGDWTHLATLKGKAPTFPQNPWGYTKEDLIGFEEDNKFIITLLGKPPGTPVQIGTKTYMYDTNGKIQYYEKGGEWEDSPFDVQGYFKGAWKKAKP